MVKSGLNHNKILQQVMLGSVDYLTVNFYIYTNGFTLWSSLHNSAILFYYIIIVSLFSSKTIILKDFFTLMEQNPIQNNM